ncbi:oxidoreductase [Lithospermum erythrorhizon]|uniref:Oxidoreductase n=1 Tax=Lithospermum erythrorhizon TaxID=34254 RepID=A0AAV3PNN9_LITER
MGFSERLIEIIHCLNKKWSKSFGYGKVKYDTTREVNAPNEHPVKAIGWAARGKSGELSPFNFSRRATGDYDISLRVLYCGISHTDLHFVKNEWGMSKFPEVPGHEIVGVVTEVGTMVTKFRVGDNIGVGSLIGSCGRCEMCSHNLENFCPEMIITYNSLYYDGTYAYGGYSNIMVVNERFGIRWPDQLPLDAGAPLLSAGIAVYSPMKYCALTKPGIHIGVVGLGGLGHLAVKFAKAFGVTVTVISTHPSKRHNAIEHLGADKFLDICNKEGMNAAAGTLDGIIDTASGVHNLQPLIAMLKYNGVLVMLGAPREPLKLPVLPMLLKRKIVAGSSIGGMKETQEMIDFAAEHKITADIEVVPMNYVNMAMSRLAKGDVKYRFVIDVGNTLTD